MKKHNIVIKYQTESDITEYHCNMIICFASVEWPRRAMPFFSSSASPQLLTLYSAAWMLPKSMPIFDLIFSFRCVFKSQFKEQSPSPVAHQMWFSLYTCGIRMGCECVRNGLLDGLTILKSNLKMETLLTGPFYLIFFRSYFCFALQAVSHSCHMKSIFIF